MAYGHVVLVGAMGVGKTTVGHELAERLGRELLDSDAVLARDHGEDGATIADRDGVATLHEFELATFVRMASADEASVIAAAASVVDTAEGREAIRDHVVVWLDAQPHVLAERRAGGHHRRSVDETEAELLRDRRRPHFASVSRVRVDTTDAAPADAVDRILCALEDL